MGGMWEFVPESRRFKYVIYKNRGALDDVDDQNIDGAGNYTLGPGSYFR